jgi:hypothetical protein
MLESLGEGTVREELNSKVRNDGEVMGKLKLSLCLHSALLMKCWGAMGRQGLTQQDLRPKIQCRIVRPKRFSEGHKGLILCHLASQPEIMKMSQ